MSTKDKWVRRFTVDETAKHKNGFTIYKITSVLFPLESPEAVTVVSVWKRFSDVQRLHRGMKALHSGLHLRGSFPVLPTNNYFKRFHSEVIEERAKSIKCLLEFVADHRLLFTSTEFVNFLQTGYPEPSPKGGVINAIRSSLHLPIEETPPLEYQTSDDETRSPGQSANTPHEGVGNIESPTANQNLDISQIRIYEAADVEIRESPKQELSRVDSFESITSIESIGSDFYDELSKVTIDKSKPSVKTKNVLPDLINFDAPSTSGSSKFEDYHTMKTETDAENMSINSTCDDSTSNIVRVNQMENSYVFESPLFDAADEVSSVASSHAETDCASDTTCIYEGLVPSVCTAARAGDAEGSYVFEAGYLVSLGARCEERGRYRRAFRCYRAGIERMLIGVRSDTDAQRRGVIKQKISKYLSYAETLYKHHLCDVDDNVLSEPEEVLSPALCPPPVSMLRRPYEDLVLYRVLDVLGPSVMLVLHRTEQTCYAMKVIRKVPHNLTEFDEYFLQRTNETRQPILPTLIPYMVPLHAYIETNSLIFLILSYAPGKNLFDYIKEYARSAPTTPNREVNLENVFTEPTRTKITDIVNDNIERSDPAPRVHTAADAQDLNENIGLTTGSLDKNMSVTELVINSQELIRNVDKVLSDVPHVENENNDVKEERVADKRCEMERLIETPLINRAVPGGAARSWAAQLLVAVDALHNCGVVCRDLSPRNILLGEKGQIILTYFVHYSGLEMALSKTKSRRGEPNLYLAPELYSNTYLDPEAEGEADERVCDYWSYGAILYELLCGVPLSYHHRSLFTNHTILHLPDGLSLEVQSLLTQLLTYSPKQRLGAGPRGVEEIKQHPYFRCVDWARVYTAWALPR